MPTFSQSSAAPIAADASAFVSHHLTHHLKEHGRELLQLLHQKEVQHLNLSFYAQFALATNEITRTSFRRQDHVYTPLLRSLSHSFHPQVQSHPCHCHLCPTKCPSSMQDGTCSHVGQDHKLSDQSQCGLCTVCHSKIEKELTSWSHEHGIYCRATRLNFSLKVIQQSVCKTAHCLNTALSYASATLVIGLVRGHHRCQTKFLPCSFAKLHAWD